MRRVVVGCAFATLAIAGCGSGGSSDIAVASRCDDDSSCPVGWSCDRATSTCVEGLLEDDYLRGRVTCTLGAVSSEAGPALGDVFVTGAVGGRAVEISVATGCERDGDWIDVALSGNGSTGRWALAFNLPRIYAATAGDYTIDPYANWASSRHAMFYLQRVVGDRPSATRDEYVAYSVSGVVSVTTAATTNGQTLSLTVDAKVARPKPVQACEATCVSQADCGAGTGIDGWDFPSCYEEYVGAPRSCTLGCEKGSDGSACAAAGGTCAVLRCSRKGCGDLAPGLDCASLAKDDCEVCCDLRSQRAGAQNLDEIVLACGCASGSPCEAECGPACTSHDPDLFSTCVGCLTSSKAKSCFDGVVKKCAADTSCTAYQECVSRCG